MKGLGRQSLWLFVALAGAQIFFLEGHINTPDGQLMFHVTQAMVQSGRMAIEPLPGWESFGGRPVETDDGTAFYAKYGLGLSLAAVPSVWFGTRLLPLAAEREKGLFQDYRLGLIALNRERPRSAWLNRVLRYDCSPAGFDTAALAYFATWTNAWVVALIGVLLFRLGIGMGLGPRWSLALALASNFMTPLWHYAGEFFSEPLVGLCLLGFLLCVRQSVEAHGRRRACFAALGGIGFGLGVLTRTATVILLPWAALHVLLAATLPNRRRMADIAAFAVGLAVPMLILAWYNWHRFGTIWETGYGDEATAFTTPLLTGLYGLLLSPGRGLIWFAPLLLLAPGGLVMMGRRHLAEPLFITGVFLSTLLLHATWHMWEGGWCWGPRFLVPVIPLMLLPAACCAKALWAWGRAGRMLIVALAATALIVAAGGVAVNYNPYIHWVATTFFAEREAFAAAGVTHYDALMRFSWRFSPLLRAYTFPVRQEPVIAVALRYPGMILGVNLVVLAALITAALAFVRTLRPSGPDRPVGARRDDGGGA